MENLPVAGEFPAQRSLTRSFDVFFYLSLNKRLSKQSWGWWFETSSRSLWRHCYASRVIHWFYFYAGDFKINVRVKNAYVIKRLIYIEWHTTLKPIWSYIMLLPVTERWFHYGETKLVHVQALRRNGRWKGRLRSCKIWTNTKPVLYLVRFCSLTEGTAASSGTKSLFMLIIWIAANDNKVDTTMTPPMPLVYQCSLYSL